MLHFKLTAMDTSIWLHQTSQTDHSRHVKMTATDTSNMSSCQHWAADTSDRHMQQTCQIDHSRHVKLTASDTSNRPHRTGGYTSEDMCWMICVSTNIDFCCTTRPWLSFQTLYRTQSLHTPFCEKYVIVTKKNYLSLFVGSVSIIY